MSYDDYGWRPYVPVAERRRKAEREMAKLRKKGHPVSPVVVEGRTIARTFWGKAWCENLERYSDYENRLPRGRTYVRNGSVVDLQVAPGEVRALVSGSSMYKVAVTISAVPKAGWTSICTDCAGAIDSLVELLQGRFSKAVMERICRQRTGLFPGPTEIRFSCSCPDWASMCKHVAAVLYGIGARLDQQPELLFKLRKVDEKDLLAKAGKGTPLSKKGPAKGKILAGGDLSAIFGLEIGTAGEEQSTGVPVTTAKSPRSRGSAKTARVLARVVPPAKPGPRRSPAATRKKAPTTMARKAAPSVPTKKKASTNQAKTKASTATKTKAAKKPKARRGEASV